MQPEEKWRPKGEQFFGLMIRARFSTSNPKIRDHLKNCGVSRRYLDPFNIMHSISKLEKKISTLNGKYDFLCDYVHHNGSSNYTSSPGFKVGRSASSVGGGGIITKKNAAITRYEYPVPNKTEKAVEDTIDIVLKCLEVSLSSINDIPYSPYSENQINSFTGNKLGFNTLPIGMYVPFN